MQLNNIRELFLYASLKLGATGPSLGTIIINHFNTFKNIHKS